jgi:hypothetical protein
MFGDPVPVEDESAIFHLVWTYVVKELDGCKKASCVCDGSSRSGQVRVLGHTYAICIDRTSSHIFYAISAAKNMLIYGADVSNAFAEAPPPKQGIFIYPDQVFNDWTGGSIKRANQSLTDMSYWSLALCKVIPNPLAYRKNTPIGFCETLD